MAHPALDHPGAKPLHSETHTVAQFYAQQSLNHAPLDEISEILNKIDTYSTHTRALEQSELAAMNHDIHLIPSGRQSVLKQARDEVLLYLQQLCGWRLPETKTKQFIDHQHNSMVAIYQHSEIAHLIYRAYCQALPLHVMQRSDINVAWVAITLMVDVAPLPLHYWGERLMDPQPLEWVEGMLTIRITHPKKLSYFDDDEPASFTRYAIPPLAARVFTHWQTHAPLNTTAHKEKKLLDALNQWLVGYYPDQRPLSALNWHRALQALWLHRYHLPPEVLNDFSDPLRHVSPRSHGIATLNRQQMEHIFAEHDLHSNEMEGEHRAKRSFRHWPHKALLKFIDGRCATRPAQPPFDRHNILPRLVYDYVEELHRLGGVKKGTLAASSITRYANVATDLVTHPLSYEVATQKNTLQAWANTVYGALRDEQSQWFMYRFFRFLTQQALTSELDLRVFDKPVRPTKVDALSLGAEDVHSLTTTLLSGGGSPLQRLFSSVATLLGYYGGLRRGEVLRLRMKDIRCTTRKGAHFDVRITRTSEGGPKGGKPRWVYMVLPEAAAKLIRLVMSLKQTCKPKTPFLGFIGESKSSRERHYLKPISKALKAQFGKRARFHHLRHAGATLLYRQGLHLACGRFSEASRKGVEPPITTHLLAESMVNARFQYWLQGREFGQVNNALLFDEIGRQLGHQYYATTRLHYLHGMEWVTPFFVPQQRLYSRAELRYILGLSPLSNDVSRLLTSLVPEYATLSVPEKKSYHPVLTHEQLNGLLMGRLNVSRVSMPHRNTDTQFNDNDWLTLWNNTTQQQAWRCANPQHAEFMWQTQACLHMLHTGQQTFAAISKVWQTFGQHKPFHIEKTALSALKTLGPLMLTQAHNFIFEGPCNQKTQKALNALRSIGIDAQLHMTLHQNRKRLDSKKWAFIQHQLLKPGDTAEKRIHNTGKTYLTLTLSVPNLPLAARHEFHQWWTRHTQPNSQG
ncbi:TPA: site-specific integrase [Vibrio parahaemolyticus]|nr:site-specific integrase [Vibrio parahaemolyticus]